MLVYATADTERLRAVQAALGVEQAGQLVEPVQVDGLQVPPLVAHQFVE